MQRLGSCPEYDILITNPPYSGDHVERLLTYCVNSNKPFILLLPNYVYMKVRIHLRFFFNIIFSSIVHNNEYLNIVI